MKFEWEKIHRNYSDGIGGSNTNRAKVLGGWIVNVDTYTDVINGGERNLTSTIVFIHDPEHKWEIDES